MTFSVVDNRYAGDGHAFVIPNQAHADRWKNNQHGDHPTLKEAEAHAERLNALWEGRTTAKMGRPHTLPAGPYADLAEKMGGVGRLAETLRVDRGTVTRAAEAGRWLTTGSPAKKLKTLCQANGVTIPAGWLPDWLTD